MFLPFPFRTTVLISDCDFLGILLLNKKSYYFTGENRKTHVPKNKHSPYLIFQPMFRALFEPIPERQDQTIFHEDLSNKMEKAKEKYPFKIVFKDIHPVRTAVAVLGTYSTNSRPT